MASWKALNVESDNESEDEVDDTKEIQIEEALKLYQTALKHHSEGPQSFEQTAAAYKALFDSEIFKYTESLSEYKRHELYGDTLVFDTILTDDFDSGPVQATGGNESAPNTLPQILHLSYKNHGQFLLETMQHWIRQHGPMLQQDVSSHVLGVLTYFAEALDKEDADLDLWLRTASVAAILGSKRIVRFCLEAVLDGYDELFDTLLRLPGLEEGFAGQQLRELVDKLEDSVSLKQKPLSSMKRKKLPEALKKRLNPYQFAPLPSDVAQPNSSQIVGQLPQRITLSATKWDWAGVGEAILRHYMAEQSGMAENIPPGSCINFNIPPEAELPASNSSELHLESEPEPPVKDTVTEAREKETPRSEKEEPATAATESVATATKEGEDVVMEDTEKALAAKSEERESATSQEQTSAPSRKRSTDSAGLPETAEGGRARSKRIRAREVTDSNMGGDTSAQDGAKQLEDQLHPYVHADQCLFEIVNDIYTRLGVKGMASPKELRDLVTGAPSALSANGIDKTAYDMFAAFQSTGAKIAPVLLSADPVDLGGASREAGLNAFLGYAKSSNSKASVRPVLGSERLATFAHTINESWLSTKEVAFAWLEHLLSPGLLPNTDGDQGSTSGYVQYRWAEDLKRHLVQIIVNMDDFIYERMVDRIDKLNTRILKARAQTDSYSLSDFDAAQIEVVETLFELHLDIYSLIRHPHSGVDAATQIVQNDRLERWSTLAREAMQLRADCISETNLDDLALRHIWASVFQMSVNDEVSPEHVIYAMDELKTIFQPLDGRTIEVQNNAVMPELSVSAVDRELVRISMKDFFLKVFDQDEKDPATVIESLEPILEPVQEHEPIEEEQASGGDPDQEKGDHQNSSALSDTINNSQALTVVRPSPFQEMRKFLDSASVNLRLSLWQRLREAYEAIEYPPKVLSCYLRSIETLVGEFKTSTYQECSPQERHVKLISRCRIIDEVVVKVLQIIRDDKSAFDCLSYEHMQSSMSAISELLYIMSAVNILQDTIRVGQLPIPRIEGLPNGTFINTMQKLNDMQLRLWMLQYQLLKEGISQTPTEFPTPEDDQFEFLRHVHHATGVRGFCHLAGRLFLRLAKDEMLRLDSVTDASNRDTELSQILYDLYGLKTFIDPTECQEFGSQTDLLDKRTATALLPFILSQAEKVDIKELPKTDLKSAIDKVHGALGRSKTNEDINLNRKILTTYFKSPVNPTTLFNCLKGVSSLPTKHVPVENAIAASMGWYFLMGNIALTKFRSQKRLTQGPIEDLNYAQAFFLQDLEYSQERWETWYRYAQANDAQLEEAVSWNADKMNSNNIELVNFQRGSIHCYTMAVACAVRDADASPESLVKVSQMYTDFGNRMYASSREPFNMNAFSIRETEHKFYSGSVSQIVYQNVPFGPLSLYTTWKFASVLFRRAIKGRPDKWWNYYMLGKCLWKMYCANADNTHAAVSRGEPIPQFNGPTWEEVVDAFVSAIENLPEKKGRGGEPVLEPHYKVISIAHKLFQRNVIDYTIGEEIIKHTSYSLNINSPESADDWERYVLAVLKALRGADKSSWHHRIISRSAHVIYDDGKDPMVAHGAKHELSQQIFTKTMAVQVWKPENERPGRHFVYTTRYTKFFIHLLDQTGDKTNLEALAKRVRRKQTDFFEHSKLWQELCLRYLKLLRRVGKIPDGHEDAVFKSLNYDEFSTQASRLEAWCQNSNTQHPVLDILRDAIELKRLNNGLMKPLLIDDLIGDTYGLLYTTVGPTLPPLPSEQPPQQQQPPPPLQPTPQQQPLSVSSLMQVQVDGSSEHSANTPFALYHPNQSQPQHQPQQPQAETAPRSRAKAVGRREIQRRAETCAQKPASVPTPTATTSTSTIPIRSPPTTALPALPLPSRVSPEKPTNESSTAAGANDQLQVPTSGTVTAAPSVTNDEPSRPASVHDDADDESELSELDESEVQEIAQQATDVIDPPRRASTQSPVISRSIFPGLKADKKDHSGTKGDEYEDKDAAVEKTTNEDDEL